MKILVAYYSRTGNTKKVAETISKDLGADIEEIVDLKNRKGLIGWIVAGKDAGTKKLTKINSIKNPPTQYDMVIIGTPTWNNTMSSSVRTYLEKNKGQIRNAAFFCTHGTSKARTVTYMQELYGKQPLAVLDLQTKDVTTNTLKVKKFVDEIKTKSND